MDRGYTDYSWYNNLNEKGVYFASRQNSKDRYRVFVRKISNRKQGIISDPRIEFTRYIVWRSYPRTLRRIGYRDPETGKHYVFVTNHLQLLAKTVADIYKFRWQIELFFKCIKQNLKIKSFVGTSKNAVLTQIWIALCVYLMMAYLKCQFCLTKSIQKMLRILQINLFEKRELMPLPRGDPIVHPPVEDRQLSLFSS